MRKMTGKLGLAVLVMLFIIGASFSAWSGGVKEASTDIIKIGTLNPLSGPTALWGISQRRCAELWADQVNANGGLYVAGKRYKVILPKGDDQGQPPVAQIEAERLIFQEKIKFIIGCNFDTTTAALVAVATPQKVITVGSTFDIATIGPHHSYAIANMWMANQSGPPMYKYFRDKHGVKKIAFLTKDFPGARKNLEILMDKATALGLEVTSYVYYAEGITDMYPQATKLIATKPELVDLPQSSPEEVGLMLKALRELGYTGLVSSESEQDIDVTSKIAGAKNVEGLFMNAGPYDPVAPGPGMLEFRAKYEKMFGVWNPDAGTKLYSAFMLGAAIQKAGTITDTDAVMQAFRTMQVRSPYLAGENSIVRNVGKTEFGINNQLGVPLVLAEVRGGEAHPVYTYLAPQEPGVTYTEPFEFKW